MSLEKLEKLRFTLSSPGWLDVMVPEMQNQGAEALKNLARLPKDRVGRFAEASDDFIRGWVQAMEWTIIIWDATVKEYDTNIKKEAESEAVAAKGTIYYPDSTQQKEQ